MFGSDVDETGDDLVESVLGDNPGAVGEAICPPNFVAEAVIDKEVVSGLRHGVLGPICRSIQSFRSKMHIYIYTP